MTIYVQLSISYCTDNDGSWHKTDQLYWQTDNPYFNFNLPFICVQSEVKWKQIGFRDLDPWSNMLPVCQSICSCHAQGSCPTFQYQCWYIWSVLLMHMNLFWRLWHYTKQPVEYYPQGKRHQTSSPTIWLFIKLYPYMGLISVPQRTLGVLLNMRRIDRHWSALIFDDPYFGSIAQFWSVLIGTE